MGRREHDVLFGVLSVQLGLVETEQVTACADTMLRSDLTLAARLEEAGHISPAQRLALETIVAGTLATDTEPVGLEDTLIRIGAGSFEIEDTFGAESIEDTVKVGPPTNEERLTTEEPGRYSLSKEVGRGGLGVVRAAFDRHLGREVAVKELLTTGTRTAAGTPVSRTTGEMIARFQQEARVTAQIEHPNIVPVYELGRRADETLYYTMRLVRGRTLKSALHDASDLGERLSLLSHFVDLCQAIAYAHSRGVIHRDIKPDNVMIGEFGETMVLDWGVAKVRGKDDIRGRELIRAIELIQGASSAETLPGAAFGTPAYMSPEQADGRIDDVDERSDVWSLGVVLYQLLTGKLPITGSNLPSLLIAVSKGETPLVQTVCPEAPRELAAVAERALAADPADRYQSAKELAFEIEAYRSGAKVSAYEYSSVELIRRFIVRNRSSVVVSVVAACLLVMLGIGAYASLLDERDRALVAELDSRENLADAFVEKARGLSSQKNWVGATLEAAAALARTEHPDARGIMIDADGRYRPRLEWSARMFAGCLDLAGVSASDEIACGTSYGVQLLKRDTGEASGRIDIKGGWVTAIVMDRSGERLVAGGDDGAVVLADRARREVLKRQFAHSGGVIAVRIPNDKEVLSAGSDGAVRAWSSSDLAPLGVRFARDVALSAFDVAQGGRILAVGDEAGGVSIRGEETFTNENAHSGAVRALAWSPDGRQLASAGDDNTLCIWDGATASLISRIPRGAEPIGTLLFTPDGEWLIAGTNSGEIERYDVNRGELDARTIADQHRLRAMLFVDGTIYTSGDDKAVRAFAAVPREGTRTQTFDLDADGHALAFVAGGEGLAVVVDDRLVVWDLGARRPRVTSRLVLPEPIALSRSGEHLASAEDKTIVVRALRSTEAKTLRTSGGTLGALALSADGKRVAAGAHDGFVRVLNVDGSGDDEVVRVHDGAVDAVTFTVDGTNIVTGGFDGDVTLMPIGVGATPVRIAQHKGGVLSVAATNETIVSGGQDGVVRVYDVKRRSLVALSPHEQAVTATTIAPDGRLIASAGLERTLQIWEASSGKLLARMREAHPSKIVALAFAEDGGVLASLDEDGRVRVWSLTSLRADRKRQLTSAAAAFGVKLDGMRLVPAR